MSSISTTKQSSSRSQESKSNTWCPLPWIFQAVRNNGDIRVCCQANTAESRGLLKKEDGTVFNANTDNLAESRNSPTLKQVRLDMLAGREPEPCLRCHREDSCNIISRRSYERDNWAHLIDFEKAQALTHEDGSIEASDSPAVYLDLRFGNLCNLKCRMCGPTDSNKWYSDQVAVWGSEFKDSHGTVKLIEKNNGAFKTQNGDYDWIDSPSFWQQINESAPDIQHIQVVGGEPLLIQKHYDLLETIIEKGNPKKVTVEYNSNVTVVPDRAWKIWKEFGRVLMGASVDGYGKVDEYIRHPSKWEDVEANLERFDREPGNYSVWLATTVQAYNALHLPDFIQWKFEKKFQRINAKDHRPIINTHPLHNPKFLNVKALPPDYKKLVEKRYEDYLPQFREWLIKEDYNQERCDFYVGAADKLLSGYVKYMNEDDWSGELSKFWYFTNKLDELRNQSLKATVPELYQSVKSFLGH